MGAQAEERNVELLSKVQELIRKSHTVVNRIRPEASRHHPEILRRVEQAIDAARESSFQVPDERTAQTALVQTRAAWQATRGLRALVEHHDVIEEEVRRSAGPALGCFGIGCSGALVTAMVSGTLVASTSGQARGPADTAIFLVMMAGVAAACGGGLAYRLKAMGRLRASKEERLFRRVSAEE